MTDPREEYRQEQQKYIDGRESDRQMGMERIALGYILRAFGRVPKLVERTAGSKYSLPWLWDLHPDAPVKVMAKHIYKWSFTDVFTRFTKTPIFEAFEDAVDSFPDQFVGAVFHANVLGDMIIHNWTAETKGTRIIPTFTYKEYGELTIQPMKHFLKTFKEHWEPTGYPLGER